MTDKPQIGDFAWSQSEKCLLPITGFDHLGRPHHAGSHYSQELLSYPIYRMVGVEVVEQKDD